MSFAFTPTATFDGSSLDSARQYFSSGSSPYADFGINQVNIQDAAFVLHFASTSDLNAWRASDRSFSVEHTGSGSTPSWDGEEFSLTSSTEYDVQTSLGYIMYTWSDLGLSDSESDDLAQQIVTAGSGSSVVTINDLG